MQSEPLLNFLTALIWPFIVLLAIIILREPLSKVIGLLSRIKYKELDIFFQGKIDAMQSTIEPEELELARQNSPELGVDSEFSNRSPFSNVHDSWSTTEELTYDKLTELLPPDSDYRRNLSKSSAVTTLSLTGALTPSEEDLLGELSYFIHDLERSPEYSATESVEVKFRELNTFIQNKITSLAELPTVKLTPLTYLILTLNSLIDSGKYNHITMDQIKIEIENEHVLEFLDENMADDTDLSIILPNEQYPRGFYPEFIEFYNETMLRYNNAYSGNERRKWGVENSGLCLLLAWTNEIVQQGSGWHPSE